MAGANDAFPLSWDGMLSIYYSGGKQGFLPSRGGFPNGILV